MHFSSVNQIKESRVFDHTIRELKKSCEVNSFSTVPPKGNFKKSKLRNLLKKKKVKTFISCPVLVRHKSPATRAKKIN